MIIRRLSREQTGVRQVGVLIMYILHPLAIISLQKRGGAVSVPHLSRYGKSYIHTLFPVLSLTPLSSRILAEHPTIALEIYTPSIYNATLQLQFMAK